jgi:hypothetical protein
MAIGRTEFQFGVSGVESTTRSLQNVATAETAVATQADAAARKVMAMDAAAAAMGVHLDSTGRVMQAAEKSSGALGRSLEVAGRGFSVLARAAAILPGFGIAGLLLGMYEGAKALFHAFDEGEKSTRMQTAALAEYTRVLGAAEKAVRDLGAAQAAAGRNMVGGAYGVDPGSLSGSARIEGARIGQADAALKDRQKRLDEEAGAIAAQERALVEKRGRYADEFSRGLTELQVARMRGELMTEAEAIGARRNLYNKEAVRTQEAATDLAARLERMRQMSQVSATGKGGAGAAVDTSLGATVGRIAAEQSPRRAMESGALAGIGGMAGESYDASAEAARARAQEMADFQIAQDQRNAMMMAHTQGAPGEPAVPSIFSMLTASDEEKAAFDQQMADAGAGIRSIYAETQRLAEDGKGMLAGLGKGLSTAAAASLLTGKSFKHAANELLKSLAVQAAGQAIWETALGVGSLAMAAMGNPTAGASAALHFKAAGMFGVLAASFAGGASMTGGMRDGGGSSAGAGGGGSSAAVGTGGGGGRGEAPVYVSVQIGEEPVASIMRRSNEREARRGGMNGHFAMGAA